MHENIHWSDSERNTKKAGFDNLRMLIQLQHREVT